ncbi:RNA polymerase sigma factor SigY [Clostridium estertheticum]|uniref:RNA polymerase sigma factor SigY n=1 Tax=Clostridium estertheticum TaxID=238834 RepID=UPI001C7DB01D|nr:RNA polymerase sigma factor SigY [Clostridium estertheticum]MBX4266966.1 RNA polymerase sigma factor SigY [Clostridium estertheticum]MBX4271415.1 RNA polymerase sigma factor SigY [Clostridium estertheticum]WLC78802.1 RNA polymerase sigma factor SigY [Clostridium estertheticum]WLC89824.1 RNA polymerase sigma factor SigY [Clostridium estertheticum]
MDEVELINKAKNGNKSALNALLKDNLNILKGYVIKMAGDPYLAQDIIQDALLKAVININKFEPKAKFSTWLIKIATNVYRDYLRKNKRFKFSDEVLVDNAMKLEDIVIQNYEYKEIMKIILALPYEKRVVFILKHYYGYKYVEISEIINCPIGTVRSRLHNAVKYIVNEIERKEII